MRILAVADEVDEALYGDKLLRLRPDLIVSCGDLPFEYLENLVSRVNVPLVYVPGNHDPDLRPANLATAPTLDLTLPGPQGCDNLDGHLLNAAEIYIAGLGGCLRYKPGPNQRTQTEMFWRALRLEMRVRLNQVISGRRLDVMVTHAPPLGCGDQLDPPHRGFAAFNRLINNLAPKVLIHGHVHPFGRTVTDHRLGGTLVVNAVPSRLLQI